MEAQELSKHKDVKCNTDLIYHEINSFGIDWILNVEINQEDEDDEDIELEKTDNYIGIYLNAESSTPNVW